MTSRHPPRHGSHTCAAVYMFSMPETRFSVSGNKAHFQPIQGRPRLTGNILSNTKVFKASNPSLSLLLIVPPFLSLYSRPYSFPLRPFTPPLITFLPAFSGGPERLFPCGVKGLVLIHGTFFLFKAERHRSSL